MVCNWVLTSPPPAKVTPPNRQPVPALNFFNLPSPPSSNFFTPSSVQLKMAASAFFTHGYFQQAQVHISGAILTD